VSVRRRVFLVVCALLVADAASAHEVRPGYLEVRSTGGDAWELLFKVPARSGRRLALTPLLPPACEESEHRVRQAPGAFIDTWTARCTAGLVGESITIDGLSLTRTDVLARVVAANGDTQTARLVPAAPGFRVDVGAGWLPVATTYGWLGVEHILLGFDHLCFVLGLFFLVGNARRLVGTVTAFTIAHSVTLAAATLGWVSVPAAPVEAAIALSIVFVAVEVVRSRSGATGLAERSPWLVAFAFGLLHGLGFAGALRDVGLPPSDIPLALAAFNVGVELGQLAFVAVLVVACRGVAALLGRGRETRPGTWDVAGWVSVPAAYAIGILATFWCMERTVGFWTV